MYLVTSLLDLGILEKYLFSHKPKYNWFGHENITERRRRRKYKKNIKKKWKGKKWMIYIFEMIK